MIRQMLCVTWLNLKAMRSRLASTAVVVVGIGGVVAVLLSLLAMSAGFRAALVDTARPDRALVLRGSSNNEMDGWLTSAEMSILSTYEGLRVVSGEVYVTLNVAKRAAGTDADVVGRGVTSRAFDLRPEVRLIAGRRFEPGRNEVIVGAKAAAQYQGLEVGDRIEVRNSLWQVVGTFAANGTSVESEVWIDLPIAQSTFRRTFSVARVQVDDVTQVDALAARIAADPRLDVILVPEIEFYAQQSASRSALINTFAYVIAGIMAVGAVVAALNTMYTVVNQRSVEIATLRALGFNRASVVASILAEAALLALVGGLLAAALIFAALDGYTTATQNTAAGNQLAFAFKVTPQLLQLGVVSAMVLGILGGLPPAIRAARMPIPQALRSA